MPELAIVIPAYHSERTIGPSRDATTGAPLRARGGARR